MTIYEKLFLIQQEIEVAKGRENTFDHFMYWTTEDILKALKPLLDKYNTTLTMNDYIEDFNGKTFVRVEGDLIDLESEHWSAVHFSAPAQIEDTKGSMRAEQRTGSASSYARKRALSGLLLLDDAADADSYGEKPKRDTKPREPKPKAEKPKPTMKPIGTCDFCDAAFFDKSEVRKCKDGRLICLECLQNGVKP